ncbi:sugar O-acetyltransferase [Vagococcus sp. BWB3-3]|uniref:Sugar O-acetyltransferase n=1 Tax=Vagococcus allomyrinae TaxID=2794353 RepID=A0A940SSW6_9ENTE|nr:DapH/DapD/GlmU-related protein [Vagococcus allomyrinae]MBP1042447.1 sugar O-acetyltransferase [Vagococcus allomyrinae]
MTKRGLIDRLQAKEILADSALFKEIHLVKEQNDRLVAELNSGYHSPKEGLGLLEKITGSQIDESVTVSLPFYTDFGRHITFGKDIFVNQNVTFVDLGGITIEDNVLIGPMSRLIAVNHLTAPAKRRGMLVSPVLVKRNVWIGANVTILPGVTIGENAIVAADSTVTKDVPKNVIVAGSPAKVLKLIESEDQL